MLRKLEVFLHQSIRKILGITMFQVAEERIHNHNVREMFYNISSIEITIAARQMNFIGKVLRSSFEFPAKQLLTACCASVRRKGRPQLHLKDSIVKNLCLLFKQVPEVRIDPLNGSMKDWINETNTATYWKQLIGRQEKIIQHIQMDTLFLRWWHFL